MTSRHAAIIAAGHCCLDIFPTFAAQSESALVPGKLIDVGPAVLAPGGSVSNVGLALHRLGASVRLLGKVGDDQFGQILLDYYGQAQSDLVDGMLISSGETTSYSIVISHPGHDRILLHCPGANHTFSAAEIVDQDLSGAAIFHFGYPPLMRRMYQNEGAELAQIFQAARLQGVFTSLDMALPDPLSQAGTVDWQAVLKRSLPFIDAFLPSLDELIFMLDRERYERLRIQYGDGHLIDGIDGALLEDLAGRLSEWGAAIIVVKLGDQGLYLATSADVSRFEAPASVIAALANPQWHGRSVFVPCFQVDVAGTTGSGDATIAGFLMGLLEQGTLAETLQSAVAVGAYSVEQVDATSGIPTWEQVQQRLVAGWPRCPVRISLPTWRYESATGTRHGPGDLAPVSSSYDNQGSTRC
jgi:sugar/nucleoside kinase (ribokinase family)